MRKLQDFLTGTQILEEVESPINGKISVIRSLAFGTYISVGGLTQSGGVLKDIWRKSLRQVQRTKRKVHRCLILGLGGGTAAKLVKEFWPDAKVTGVDIDPLMVEMGRKYLGLNEIGMEIEIEDAYDYLNQESKISPSKRLFSEPEGSLNRRSRAGGKNQNYKLKIKNYDLILVDLYIGYKFPKRFEGDYFFELIRKLLTENGIAVFNRLYSRDKRPAAVKFGNKLEKIFKKVEIVYPEANVIYLCF